MNFRLYVRNLPSRSVRRIPSAIDSSAERSVEVSELRLLRRAKAIAMAQSPTSPSDTIDVGEFAGKTARMPAVEMAMFAGSVDAEQPKSCTAHVLDGATLFLVLAGEGETPILETNRKNSDDLQKRNGLRVRATARDIPQVVNGEADKDTLRLIDRTDPRQALAPPLEVQRNRQFGDVQLGAMGVPATVMPAGWGSMRSPTSAVELDAGRFDELDPKFIHRKQDLVLLAKRCRKGIVPGGGCFGPVQVITAGGAVICIVELREAAEFRTEFLHAVSGDNCGGGGRCSGLVGGSARADNGPLFGVPTIAEIKGCCSHRPRVTANYQQCTSWTALGYQGRHGNCGPRIR